MSTPPEYVIIRNDFDDYIIYQRHRQSPDDLIYSTEVATFKSWSKAVRYAQLLNDHWVIDVAPTP